MRKYRCFSIENVVKIVKKQSFLSVILLKNDVFGLKLGLILDVITAFLGVFRGFLGLKLCQMHQLLHVFHGTVLREIGCIGWPA